MSFIDKAAFVLGHLAIGVGVAWMLCGAVYLICAALWKAYNRGRDTAQLVRDLYEAQLKRRALNKYGYTTDETDPMFHARWLVQACAATLHYRLEPWRFENGDPWRNLLFNLIETLRRWPKDDEGMKHLLREVRYMYRLTDETDAWSVPDPADRKS